MTDAQRVDVESEMFRSLTRLKASRLAVQHADDLLAVQEGLDALLLQVAELQSKLGRTVERAQMAEIRQQEAEDKLAAQAAEIAKERDYAADAAARVLKAELAQRAAERAREALLGYVRHGEDCETRFDSMHKPRPDCTCGLAAAFLAANGAETTGARMRGVG